MIPGVSYDKIDDEGLHITVDGNSQVLPVDNIIICAGQEPMRDIVEGVDVAWTKWSLIVFFFWVAIVLHLASAPKYRRYFGKK